ncbi:MAG TPA: hypothetical protein P5261_07135 [Thermovirgaceae bacterium]|nr:hypothetical protein [Thermovirgaceae bacterium]
MKGSAEPGPEKGRGAPGGLPVFSPRNRLKGYSIAELLVVLLLVSMFAAMLYPVVGGLLASRTGTPESARMEAKRVERWLNRILQTACIRQRPFDIVHQAGYKDNILVHWYNPSEYERYRTGGRCTVYFKTTSCSRCYSPRWHTMSPAFTMSFHVPEKEKRKVAEIVVSVYCRVLLTEFFP